LQQKRNSDIYYIRNFTIRFNLDLYHSTMKNPVRLLLIIAATLYIWQADVLSHTGPASETVEQGVNPEKEVGPGKAGQAAGHVNQNARPVFTGGLAQKVEAFSDPDTWIRHDLWVETEFDIDGDGQPDRVHVSVTRPPQTESGLKLPSFTSPVHTMQAPVPQTENISGMSGRSCIPSLFSVNSLLPMSELGERPVISNDMVDFWVPRGFIAVHSSAPGTGYSQGCPTIGTEIEALAPKAVIDWLNGRAKGYTTPFGEEEVKAYWTTGR
jgi:hypothetical protein